MIRHGASLLRAFAGASVPRLTVVLRKAYGGAVITMNSKDLGADVVFAWPGPRSGSWPRTRPSASSIAVACARRGPGLGAKLAAAYAEEHLTAPAAAAGGFVDEVIEPGDTRASLAWALASLEIR